MDIELGSVRGYRAWSFGTLDGVPVLYSQWGMPIGPYGTVEAECRCGHDAPTYSCECGIYAYKQYPFRVDPSTIPSLFGSVDLFGRVIIHELGYRAQYAIVHEIYDHSQCLCHDYPKVDLLHENNFGAVLRTGKHRKVVSRIYCPSCWAKVQDRYASKEDMIRTLTGKSYWDVEVWSAEEVKTLVLTLKSLYAPNGESRPRKPLYGY